MHFVIRFIYKTPDTLRYAIFIEFLKLEEGGGGHFYMQNKKHF